jgi:uncharacterized protein YfaS (alpha-2-macroglobulin family)
MGSADIPYRIFQDFFVDIDAPVQLTVGDTMSLPVAVHNYTTTKQTIQLALKTADGLQPAGNAAASLTLDGGEVGKVYFPLKAAAPGAGQVTIEARSAQLSDAVRRRIPVIPASTRSEISQGTVLRGDAKLSLDYPPMADLDTR